MEIPEDLGRRIVSDPGDLPRAALEALALEAIRGGKITIAEARRLLGVSSRYEMDAFLKAHGVFLDLTLDDVCRDSEAARALPGDCRCRCDSCLSCLLRNGSFVRPVGWL